MNRETRILILGDIVGRAAAQALCNNLQDMRAQFPWDYLIVNAENVVQGSGLTPEVARRLFDAGCDIISLGDHAFRKKQIKHALKTNPHMIRPMNLPAQAWGTGHTVIEKNGCPPLAVACVLGRIFMPSLHGNNPFEACDEWLNSAPKHSIKILEIHAEASSEKQALGWHVNGKASASYGTHTHTPTTDLRILPNDLKSPFATSKSGTAYITDIGMCGPINSVIGRSIEQSIRGMHTQLPTHLPLAEGPIFAQGIYLTVDSATQKCLQAVQIHHPLSTMSYNTQHPNTPSSS